MKKSNCDDFAKKFERLIKNHMRLTETTDISHVLTAEVPYALLNILKKNNLTRYNYNNSVIGGAGVEELDKMCVWQNLKDLLELFAYVEAYPHKFNYGFGDNDYHLTNIQYNKYITTFNIKNSRSGLEATIRFEKTKYHTVVEFLNIDGEKVHLRAKFDETDYSASDYFCFTDFQATYSYKDVFFINGVFNCLTQIYTGVKFSKK